MKFWKSFMGHVAFNAYNEIKKEEKETQRWNSLFQEMMEFESVFNKYLESVGITDVYVANIEFVNNGDISPVKREVSNLRKKVNDYLALGGLGSCIHNLKFIDDDIDKMKYLKEIGQIDRQVEFEYDDINTVQNKIKAEQEEIKHQQEYIKKEQHRHEVNSVVVNDLNTLSGIDFEIVCQQLIENMGFDTETTKASGDGGIDLIAYNHQPLLSGKYIIQCKRYSGSVGEPIIRDLYGVVTSERANKGILMTTGYFTKSAVSFANGKQIELIDGDNIKFLLKKYGIMEKCFEEVKNDFIDESIHELEKILGMLSEEEYNPYGFTKEERKIIEEKSKLYEEKRIKENEKLLVSKEVNIFNHALEVAENRDKHKVSTEIYEHYIDHINCILQLVTDNTTITRYDLRGDIIETFTGTIFYFILADKKNANLYDIINKDVNKSLKLQGCQGAVDLDYSINMTDNFIMKSVDSLKEIILITDKIKIVLQLPYKNDYINAFDYLFILNNTINIGEINL